MDALVAAAAVFFSFFSLGRTSSSTTASAVAAARFCFLIFLSFFARAASAVGRGASSSSSRLRFLVLVLVVGGVSAVAAGAGAVSLAFLSFRPMRFHAGMCAAADVSLMMGGHGCGGSCGGCEVLSCQMLLVLTATRKLSEPPRLNLNLAGRVMLNDGGDTRQVSYFVCIISI